MNNLKVTDNFKDPFKKEKYIDIFRVLTRGKNLLLTVAALLFFPALWILPLFNYPQYSIIRNTVSAPGISSMPVSLIINLLITSLAVGSLIAGWGHYQGKPAGRIILLTFCISLLLSGLFNEVPINKPEIDKVKADWHEYFVATYTLSFILLCLVTAFNRPDMTGRTIALSSAFSVIIIKVLAAESDFALGILDRLLFMIMIFWLLNIFIISISQKTTEIKES
jgi:hypothetical protein